MKMQLISKLEETKDVTSFIFEPEREIKWSPGQYLHYNLPHQQPDSRGTERWFTISSAPFEGHIKLTTRQAAKGSSTFKKALFNLDIGSCIEADTSDGCFLINPSYKKHIFVAGGIGITPYRSMIVEASKQNAMPDIHLLYKNHSQDLVFGDELSDIAKKHHNLKIEQYISPNNIKQKDLQKFINNDAMFYLSGPTGLVKEYKEGLLNLGVSSNRLKTDFFPGYQAINN